jgi:hypothetical protein
VLDTEKGDQCSRLETAITWNQAGPAGPAGPAGAAGEKGEKGEKGDPGTVASFDAIDELPCTRNGDTGKIDLTYDADGKATMTCVLPCRSVEPARSMDPLILELERTRTNTGTTCAEGEEHFSSFHVEDRDDGQRQSEYRDVDIAITNTSGQATMCAYRIGQAAELNDCITGDGVLTATFRDDERHDDSDDIGIKVIAKTPGSYKITVSNRL